MLNIQSKIIKQDPEINKFDGGGIGKIRSTLVLTV